MTEVLERLNTPSARFMAGKKKVLVDGGTQALDDDFKAVEKLSECKVLDGFAELPGMRKKILKFEDMTLMEQVKHLLEEDDRLYRANIELTPEALMHMNAREQFEGHIKTSERLVKTYDKEMMAIIQRVYEGGKDPEFKALVEDREAMKKIVNGGMAALRKHNLESEQLLDALNAWVLNATDPAFEETINIDDYIETPEAQALLESVQECRERLEQLINKLAYHAAPRDQLIREIKDELKNLTEAQQALNDEIARLKRKIELLEESNTTLEKKCSDQALRISDLLKENKKMEGEWLAKLKEIEDKHAEHMREMMLENAEKLKAKDDELAAKNKEIESVLKDLDKVKAELAQYVPEEGSGKMTYKMLENLLAQTKKRSADLQKMIDDLRDQLDGMRNEKKDLLREIEKLEGDAQSIRAEAEERADAIQKQLNQQTALIAEFLGEGFTKEELRRHMQDNVDTKKDVVYFMQQFGEGKVVDAISTLTEKVAKRYGLDIPEPPPPPEEKPPPPPVVTEQAAPMRKTAEMGTNPPTPAVKSPSKKTIAALETREQALDPMTPARQTSSLAMMAPAHIDLPGVTPEDDVPEEPKKGRVASVVPSPMAAKSLEKMQDMLKDSEKMKSHISESMGLSAVKAIEATQAANTLLGLSELPRTIKSPVAISSAAAPVSRQVETASVGVETARFHINEDAGDAMDMFCGYAGQYEEEASALKRERVRELEGRLAEVIGTKNFTGVNRKTFQLAVEWFQSQVDEIKKLSHKHFEGRFRFYAGALRQGLESLGVNLMYDPLRDGAVKELPPDDLDWLTIVVNRGVEDIKMTHQNAKDGPNVRSVLLHAAEISKIGRLLVKKDPDGDEPPESTQFIPFYNGEPCCFDVALELAQRLPEAATISSALNRERKRADLILENLFCCYCGKKYVDEGIVGKGPSPNESEMINIVLNAPPGEIQRRQSVVITEGGGGLGEYGVLPVDIEEFMEEARDNPAALGPEIDDEQLDSLQEDLDKKMKEEFQLLRDRLIAFRKARIDALNGVQEEEEEIEDGGAWDPVKDARQRMKMEVSDLPDKKRGLGGYGGAERRPKTASLPPDVERMAVSNEVKGLGGDPFTPMGDKTSSGFSAMPASHMKWNPSFSHSINVKKVLDQASRKKKMGEKWKNLIKGGALSVDFLEIGLKLMDADEKLRIALTQARFRRMAAKRSYLMVRQEVNFNRKAKIPHDEYKYLHVQENRWKREQLMWGFRSTQIADARKDIQHQSLELLYILLNDSKSKHFMKSGYIGGKKEKAEKDKPTREKINYSLLEEIMNKGERFDDRLPPLDRERLEQKRKEALYPVTPRSRPFTTHHSMATRKSRGSIEGDDPPMTANTIASGSSNLASHPSSPGGTPAQPWFNMESYFNHGLEEETIREAGALRSMMDQTVHGETPRDFDIEEISATPRSKRKKTNDSTMRSPKVAFQSPRSNTVGLGLTPRRLPTAPDASPRSFPRPRFPPQPKVHQRGRSMVVNPSFSQPDGTTVDGHTVEETIRKQLGTFKAEEKALKLDDDYVRLSPPPIPRSRNQTPVNGWPKDESRETVGPPNPE